MGAGRERETSGDLFLFCEERILKKLISEAQD